LALKNITLNVNKLQNAEQIKRLSQKLMSYHLR